MSFTHLHVHTEFSMLDGLSNINKLVTRAQDLGMDSLGITDHGGMYGVVDFYSACKAAGIKPIIGCELYVAPGKHTERSPMDKTPFHLTVLAQNNVGYKNLMQLVTKSNLEGFYYKPRISKDLLAEHADGLVVLSGCPSAEMSRLIIDGNIKEAEDLVRWYQASVPNFYLEIQRHTNLPFLDGLNAGLVKIAEHMDIPLVATNDLHYVNQEDARFQDVMVCVQTNTTVNDENRMKMSDESYYLKGPDEMAAMFADLPEALANTQKIAEMCETTLDFSTLHLPQYDVPEGEDADDYLGKLCWQGFTERYPDGGTEDAKTRLGYELEVIKTTQYPNYFLVVWDIADFARKNDIVFGVRGSAASSLALYCLGITEIDPMEFRLVFERFLNIERKEMPDIDMDFQDDRREEAIKYVTKKYGPGHVAQIISFGTMGAKASIRDSGRALGIPLADADRLARLIPTKLGITLQDAWDETPELQAAVNADAGLRRLFDTARGLEGVVRHSSTHAAAVVISQEPLVDHVPLQRPTKGDESGVAMTQYPMGPVAKLGLLKMDFLGLINYSILSNALKLIKKHQDIEFRLPDIKFDDQATYDLLASAETASVFQLESAGMRRHIKELKPGSLAELAAMVALYRPGPMEHIGRFIDSKFGKVPIEYPHPALEEILEETYGVIVYQDQVLHILRKFAGYTLGSADIVRKAMGKKDANLMAQERAKFLAGAEEQGYDNVIAGQVFDLIEPFAGYAFNKAHSVCYAVVAYWTAYFKANYPVEYMTCVLNAYEGNAEKMAATIAECARLDISILPPSVNHSEVRFSVDTMTHDKRAIRFGLGNIKGVGDQAVQELVTERVDGGAFKTLEDFGRRAGSNAANRRVIEALAKVGALDMFGNRASLLASVDSITHLLQSEARLKDSGQSTMFDLFGASVPTPLADIELVDAPELGAREVALWERDLLGISLTTRVLDPRHAPDGAILSREQLNEISENEKVMLVGMVTGVRLQSDKNQRRIAFVTLEIFDGSSVDVAVWSKTYEQTSSLWADSSLVQMKGPVRFRNDERSVHCDEAIAYELPEGADELPAQFPVHEPRMEQWVAPTAPPSLAEAPLDQAESDHEPEQMPDQVAKERLEPVGSMATPMPPSVAPEPTPSALKPSPAPNGPSPISAGQAYVGPPSTPADSNGYANSGMPTQPMRRKLLINMTETDRPDEDQMLLREVLQTLLDYPGTDAVDLLITSEGRNWRLEMPIITTGFCPALETRIHDLLERPDAITIADGAPVAVS